MAVGRKMCVENLAALVCAVTLTSSLSSPARAQGDRPTVHPIYVHVHDAPQNDLALKRFTTAVQRFGMGPVEIVDIDEDPAPQTADKLRTGIDLTRKLDFAAAQATLDDAAAEVAATGGGGLDAAALSDLYLYRAWTISRADFNTDHLPAPAARAQAFAELRRAAMLVPGRELNRQQFPPFVLEDWARATAEVRARPQTTLVVRAAPEASVTCDGGAPVSGPATFVGLVEGEHLIHVDEPGWAAWGGTISVAGPAVDVPVPARRALSLEDAAAAAHARRMGTAFALVGEPRPGRDGGLTLSLRLVDATGARRDSAIEAIAGDGGAFDAAVMRLDEQARRIARQGDAPAGGPLPGASASTLPPAVLVAPPRERPRLGDDPAGWARDHWPLLVAVGAMVTTVVILSISVGNERPTR